MIQLEGSGGNGKQWSIISSDDVTGAAAAAGPGNFVIYDDSSGGLGDVLTLTGVGGSMGLGVQNPGAKLHVSGGNIKVDSGYGIDFSATTDGTGAVSEILQDYEEGEWTPEIVGTTGGTAVASTPAGSGGWYVRVGNTVWLNFYFANPAITGTMSGSLRLNLPFTSANNDRFDNGGGGNLTYTRNLKSGDDHRRITLNVDRNISYARFKTLYDNSTSETADLTQTMAALGTSTLIKGNIIILNSIL